MSSSDADRIMQIEEMLRGQQPARSLWLHLCERFQDFEDEELIERAAARLEPLLETWSATQRFTPYSWIEYLLEGEPVDWMAIARSLDLRGKRIGYVHADLLSQSPELIHLTHLNMAYNGLQNAGTEALLSEPVIANLTHLDLAGNSVELNGVKAIASCEHLARLTHLDLTGNWVDDEGARALAESPHLSALQSLVLRGNPIKEEGALALAESPHLSEEIKRLWRAD